MSLLFILFFYLEFLFQNLLTFYMHEDMVKYIAFYVVQKSFLLEVNMKRLFQNYSLPDLLYYIKYYKCVSHIKNHFTVYYTVASAIMPSVGTIYQHSFF